MSGIPLEQEGRLLLCSVYRSPRRDGMYLYVNKRLGLDVVPEALLQQFGPPRHAMDLPLRPGRTLARVDVDKVWAALREQGWYLQWPPPPDEDLYLAAGHARRAP